MIYEYKSLFESEILDSDGPDLELNKLGKDEWELCCKIGHKLIFKRSVGFRINTEVVMNMIKQSSELLSKRIQSDI